MSTALDAIVLAGGRASRLDGVVKPSLTSPDGRTTLRLTLDACAAVGARRVIVVGPPEQLAGLLGPYEGRVEIVQEEPPWSGPARGIAAGLAALEVPPPNDSADDPRTPTEAGFPTTTGDGTDSVHATTGAGEWVLVLACDMPQVVTGVRALVEATLARDGVVAYASGRRHWLLGLYNRTALAAACARLPRPGTGRRDPSAWELLGALDLAEVPLPDAVAADLDTPDDLARLGFSRGTA